MSSEKRSKEDTWRPEELQESLKNVFADSSGHKSKHKGSRRSEEKRRKGDDDDRIEKSHRRNYDVSDAAKKASRDQSKVEDADNQDTDGKTRSRRDESGRRERKKHQAEEGEERFDSRSDRRDAKRESGKDSRHQGNSEEKQDRRRSKHRESDKKERPHREMEENGNRTWVEEEKRSERRDARKEAQRDSRRRGDDLEEKRERRSKHRESERKEKSHPESQDNRVEKPDPKRDQRERRDDEQPRATNGVNEREHRRSRHKESKRREERHRQDEAESWQQFTMNGDKENDQHSANTTVPSQNDEYEDDFEDYEDDFKDDVSSRNEADEQEVTSEMEALKMAMMRENEATYRQTRESANTSRSSSATSKTTARSRQTFINFTAAKQRQINKTTSMRMKQRGKELMNLIELDVTSCSLFEMPPVKEYELYIKSYGRSNTKQAFVQCHDDVLDRDVQTEPIETRDVTVQHPFEGASVINVSNEDSNDILKSNPVRLSTFLEKASQVMNALLEESMSHSNTHGKLQTNKHSVLFSEGYSIVNSELPFLGGRYVTCAQFHPHQVNLLLTVHSSLKLNGSNSNVGDILCVWNINNLSQPQRILRSKSGIGSCCFSPFKSTLAFAGTVDGAVLVWDLREPVSMHHYNGDGEVKWTLRFPTFSTYGAYNDETHHSAIVKVQPVVSAGGSIRTSTHKNDETSGLSFQLASLDEQGVIHFWVVIDLDVSDSAGSESDFGLVPGGRVKLLRSSTIILESPSRNLSQTIQAKDMKFSSTDPNQFYVATDSGCILHGTRHGDRVSPKCYRTQSDALDEVSQLDLSPFGLPCFLAASSDGSIYLYSLSFESPLLTWSNSTGGMPIVCMAWSRSRPSVFYVVDVTSKLYAWELLTSAGGPVKTEQFTTGRLITMELSCDQAATGKTPQGKAPTMVISDDKGGLDVHVLNQHFAVADGNEMEKMVAFLDSLK